MKAYVVTDGDNYDEDTYTKIVFAKTNRIDVDAWRTFCDSVKNEKEST